MAEKFEKALRDLNSQSALESLIICIHTMLVEQAFRTDNNLELPTDWRQGFQFNVVHLKYRHPKSDVPLNISVVVQGQGDKAFAAITTSGVLGDSTEVRKVDINFKDYFSGPQGATFKTPEDAVSLCQRLEKDLIGPVKILIVGNTDCPFLNIPYPLKSGVIRRLSAAQFRFLSETCKEFHKLWDDESIWKHYLGRDFGKSAVTETDRLESATKYKDAYRTRFVQKKEEQQRRLTTLMEPTHPHPPPGVYNPGNYYPPRAPGVIPGMIGGGYDTNPLGGFPLHGEPGGLARHPFQPNIRPLRPYDPDAGLFGPRPPGRGGPRPYNPFGGGGGRPNNPFGGGGSGFPGGGFF